MAARPALSAAPTPAQAVAHLEATERRLLQSERTLLATEEQAAAAVRRRAYAQSLRAMTQIRLARSERLLRARLGALARRQDQAHRRALGGTKQLSHWLDLDRLWRTVAAHDRRLYDEMFRARATVDAELASEQAALVTLGQARTAARRTRNALAEERRRRAALVAKLNRRPPPQAVVARWHQQGQQALAAAAKQASLVPPDPDEGLTADPTSPSFDHRATPARTPARELAAAATPADGAVGQGLPWPAEGPLRGHFGDRIDLSFGTVTRHQGIAIAAPAGSPVRSVAAGQVVFADWLTGFGRTVIVAHGHTLHSVHAHLHAMHVRRGQQLGPQDAIGEVGDTGSLRGTLLYFELRQNGEPIDPLQLLARRP